MEQATDTNPGSPKRVRVDPTPTNAAQKTQSPLACAQESLQAFISSLPPSTASILLRLARNHLQLRAHLHNKKTQIEKMTNDVSFLPRSARVNFKLSGSKPAEQEAEFQTLQTETATLVDKFQRDLKEKIQKATEIEKKLLLTQLNDDLVVALRVATKALLLTYDSSADPDRILSNILDNFSTTFLAFLETDKATFQLLFKSRHSLVTFPCPYVATIHEVPDPPPPPPQNPATQGTQNTQGSQFSLPDTDDDTTTTSEPTDSLMLNDYRQRLASQPDAPPPANAPAAAAAPAATTPAAQTRPSRVVVGPLPFALTINKVKRVLEHIFVLPWEKYILQSKHNATSLALQKLATDHFDSTATETAAMEIDTEPPARRELIEDLVQKAVDKRTAKLNSEIGRLRSQLSEKNQPRGQATGTSTNKLSAPPSQGRSQSQSQNRNPAAAKPNTTAATAKNKTSKAKNSTMRSNSKNNKSRGKKKQSSRTGTRS